MQCNIARPRPTLNTTIQQRLDQMDRPMCDDIVYYKMYKAYISQTPWYSQTDAQRWVCYMNRIIHHLENLQVSLKVVIVC